MLETFQLKKGTLTFKADRLLIADDFAKERRMGLFRSGMWTLFGIFSVLRFTNTGDLFLLWTGSVIGAAHLALFIFLSLRSTLSEIPYAAIRVIERRQRFGNHFLDIRLTNNTTRRVSGLEAHPELDRRIASIGKAA